MPDVTTVRIVEVESLDMSTDRIRKKPGDIRGLAASLEANGQIQPIVLQDDELISGWRRCMAVLLLKTEGKAVKGLEVGFIEAIEKKDLSPYDRLVIEYEENKRRKSFEKAEEALAIARIKAQLEEIHGKTITNRLLAKELNYSTGQIGMALEVADAVTTRGHTELLEQPSIAGAYKKLRATEKLAEILERVQKAEAAGDLDVSFMERLHHGDAHEYMRSFPPDSFDLVQLDPPWGIGIDSYDRNHHYGSFDDSADVGAKMALELIPEAYRILKNDTYLLLWFGIQHYQFLIELLTKTGFKVNPVPFIWYKTNKAGSQNDPTRTTINTWEPLFIAEKGEPRMFKHAEKNMLEYPLPTERTHYAQKNIDMLVDLIERFSFGSMKVLDSTFGSGSFLVAAQRLNRVFYGAEKDKTHFDNATNWLKTAQAMK